MPQSLLEDNIGVDLGAIEKKYGEALEDFFRHREEKALFDVSNLGKELVLSRHGPDVLLEMHARSLRKMVERQDPVTISRMVINGNEVLLSGIMAYAMNYYSYMDLLDNERRKLEAVKAQLQAQAASLEEANRKLQEVDRDREQMLMQQSRLAAMGEMLVNISHQWRQPLNVLGLILQELNRACQRGTMTSESLEASVSRARQLIGHMSQTIDDFRNYLNPEKETTSFDLEAVVGKAVSMVGESLRDVAVDVQAPDEPIAITGHRNEYIQAIINILINARDVCREREIRHPRIYIRIFRESGRSVVTVADNAGGISPDIIDRIFQPYFTTKAPDKGTGIGLFMSKTIIEKNMNGSLTARNAGEGAEFRIEV